MKKILVRDHTVTPTTERYVKIKGTFIPAQKREERPLNV